ncbi:MAG: acyl-CoA thioesterase [Clostridia bacterium]|nr:acyl-CoA thioesterase [Clostridia bacterium]
MNAYLHRVQYYETDMMGVVHHANYVHWMEEARIDFMDQLGFPYAAMEEKGVISPVKSVSCEYKRSCTFGDEIRVTVSIADFNGVVLGIKYQMEKASDGETVCEARSEHVFLNREGRFVRLKREMPAFCAALEALIQEGKDREQRHS